MNKPTQKRILAPLMLILLLGFYLTACDISFSEKSTTPSLDSYVNLISNKHNFDLANTDGEWHFFSNFIDEDGKLYRCRPDGSELSIVLDARVSCVTVYGDWLLFHYVDESTQGLYKIKKDGSELSQVTPIMVCKPFLYKDKVYFSNYDDGGKTYVLDLQTLEAKKLNDDYAERNFVYDDWVYYENHSDEYKLYRMRLDGSQQQAVTNVWFSDLDINQNGLIYNDAGIKYCALDGTNIQELADVNARDVSFTPSGIFYITMDYHLFRLDGNSKEGYKSTPLEAALNPGGDMCVLGDWIYYRPYFEDQIKTGIARIKVDGTQFEFIDLEKAKPLQAISPKP